MDNLSLNTGLQVLHQIRIISKMLPNAFMFNQSRDTALYLSSWLPELPNEQSKYVTGWTTKESRFNSHQGLRFLSSSQHSDRSWGQPSLLLSWYLNVFSRKYNGRSVKLTFHLRVLPMLLRMRAAILPLYMVWRLNTLLFLQWHLSSI